MPDPIALGEWTPDRPDRKNAAMEAQGVISIAGDYAPLKDLSRYGSQAATTGTCLGFKGVYNSSADGAIFMGDSTKLYTLASRVATNVSKVGGYSVATEAWWQFEQFGSYVVAVAPSTAPQVYQMGVSSAFADLSGSPPQASCIATVNDFLMMGKDFTVHWSAFNDITSWTPSATTQAGNQLLNQSQGKIQCIVGAGEYAAIFQERAIRRAIYVGPPVKFDFGQDSVETARGCVSPFAAVKFGRLIYYASDDGFYAFDGSGSTPIGAGKVDDYYARNLNYGYRHRICAAVDSVNKLIVFGIPSGTSTNISEILIYSLGDGRWTHDYVSLEHMSAMPVEALTVDNFDLFEPSDSLDSPNLDAINIDSSVFDEKRRLLAGVSSTGHLLGTFTGANRAAIVDTGEFETTPGRRALITELWPVGDFQQASISASVGYRRALPGASVQFTGATSMNRVGFCPQRIDARYVRARLRVAAGATWRRLEGVHATAEATGGR